MATAYPFREAKEPEWSDYTITTEDELFRSKMNLLDLVAYLKNVSEACRVMGYSRDTFYQVKKAYEEDGIKALKEKSRRKPNIKN